MIRIHNDLLLDIEVYTEQLQYALDSHKRTEKQMDKQCPKDIKAMSYNTEVRGCSDDTEWNRLIGRLEIYNARIDYYSAKLNDLMKYKKDVEVNMLKCEGIDRKVYYLHIVENLTLLQIAEKLEKSVRYIEKINSEIGKRLKGDLLSR